MPTARRVDLGGVGLGDTMVSKNGDGLAEVARL
jgi:hypothetical protein